jgi:DNA polymerase III subunit beta
MKFTVIKSDLAKLLQIACSFPENKAPMPILKHALISVGSGVLQVQASDLKQSVAILAPCTTHATGSVAVNSRLLSDNIGALPEGPIDLRIDGTRLAVSSGRRSYKVPFEVSENYPKMREADASFQPLSLPASEIVSLIDRCQRAALDDESNPKKNSMLLEIGDGAAVAVALDGNFIAVARSAYSGASGITSMIPIKAMKRLALAIGEYSGAVKITRSMPSESGSVGIFFEFGSVRFHTSTFDRASFPTYEVVMSQIHGHAKAIVPRQAFSESVAAVSKVFDRDDYPKITISVKDGLMRLFARSTAKGTAEDFIEGISYKGIPFHVGLSAEYLRGALAPVGTKEVLLGFLSNNNPVSITVPDSDAYSALLGVCSVDAADVAIAAAA